MQNHDKNQGKPGAVPGKLGKALEELGPKGKEQNVAHKNHEGDRGENVITSGMAPEKPGTNRTKQNAAPKNHGMDKGVGGATGEMAPIVKPGTDGEKENAAPKSCTEDQGKVANTAKRNKSTGAANRTATPKKHIPPVLQGGTKQKTPRKQCLTPRKDVSKLGKGPGPKKRVSRSKNLGIKCAAKRRRVDSGAAVGSSVIIPPGVIQDFVRSTPDVEVVTEEHPEVAYVPGKKVTLKTKMKKNVPKKKLSVPNEKQNVPQKKQRAKLKKGLSTPRTRGVEISSRTGRPKVQKCSRCDVYPSKRYTMSCPSYQRLFAWSVKSLIRREVIKYCKSQPAEDVLAPFSWDDYVAGVQKHCPLLYAGLLGALTRGIDETVTCKGQPSKPILGGIVAMLMHQRKVHRFRRFQTINSLLLRVSGAASRKVMGCLARVGFTMHQKALEKVEARAMDILENGACPWRASWEKELAKGPEAPKPIPEAPQLVPDAPEPVPEPVPEASEPILEEPAVKPIDPIKMEHAYAGEMAGQDTETPEQAGAPEEVIETPEQAPSPPSDQNYMYTLCLDDVQYFLHDLDGDNKKCSGDMMTLACMDRIPPKSGLSEVQPSMEAIKAIPLQAFLPSRQDVLDDFQERKLVISRVLTKYMKCFKKLKGITRVAIKHPYMKESAAKSKVAPLGMPHEMKTRLTSEEVSIHLAYLQKYVPHHPVQSGENHSVESRENHAVDSGQNHAAESGENHAVVSGSIHDEDSEGDRRPSQMVLFTDFIASRAVIHAVNGNRTRGPNPELSNFLPTMSDYHKNMFLLQDAFHDLWKQSTDIVPGTMLNLERVFEITNAHYVVRKAPEGSLELMSLTTEAYILAAAMDFLDLEKMDGELTLSQERDPEKLLSDVSEHVARLSCQTEKLESVVRATAWKQSKEQDYRYCICKRDRDDGMVACGNRKCPHGTWFHFKCLRLREEDLPKGDAEWYCSRVCHASVDPLWKEDDDGTVDHIFEYTKAVLWHGVNILARHDAIRENDGLRMIRHWMYDLLHLFARGDHRYMFSLAHNFVLSVVGGCSERVAHQLTWSRTVNPSGGPGKNIPVNQHMLHYRELFKDALRVQEGAPSVDVMKQHGKLLVCVGDRLTDVYGERVSMNPEWKEWRLQKRTKEIMKKVTKNLRQAGVSRITPGRFHRGFQDFVFNPYDIDAKQLRKSIKPNNECDVG